MYNTIEIAQKEVLAAVNSMTASKLVASTWGNVSGRVILDINHPIEEHLIVITPSGVDYDNLTSCDLPVINMAGKQVSGNYKPSSEQKLHIAILKAKPDIHCVMHTHSLYASAFAVARKPIEATVEDMVQIAGGKIEVAEYAYPGTEQVAINAVKALHDSWGVLLANHGLVGVGRTAHEAYKVCLVIEKAAQINILAKSLGAIHLIDNQDTINMRLDYLNVYSKSDMGGNKLAK